MSGAFFENPSHSSNGTHPSSVSVSRTESDNDTDWSFVVMIIFWVFAGMMILATIVVIWWQARQDTSMVGSAASVHTPEARVQSDVEEKQQAQEEQQQNASIDQRHNRRRGQPYLPPRRVILLILPTLSAFIALAFSVVPHASCKYVGIYSRDYTSIQGFGLWSAYGRMDSRSGYDDKRCFSIVNNQDFYVDTPMTAARVFAVLATTLGALALFFLVCLMMNQSLRRGILAPSTTALLVLAFVFELDTLVVKAAHFCDDAISCSIETAAGAAITACVYWAIAVGGTVSFLLI